MGKKEEIQISSYMGPPSYNVLLANLRKMMGSTFEKNVKVPISHLRNNQRLFWDICSIASLSLLRPYIGGAIVTPSRGLILHWSFYMSSIVSITSSSSHSLQQSGPSLPYNEVSYLILQWSFNVYTIILERNSKLKGREQVVVLGIFN